MLPSMPFLSTNSETSIPLPECASESHTKSIAGEKELPDNGKDNGASKKVLDEKNRINNKTNASISSTRQKLPSKAQRELEANKAMFLNSDPSTDEIKDTNYAIAFFDKVKSRFNSNKSNSKFETFQSILNTFNPQTETPCELYNKLTELFGSENADLTEEFLTFLTPGQATEIGRFMDYFTLTCMADFIERLQIFFSSKPAQLRKIFWCLESLAEKPENELTIDCIKNSILPFLKGNQYLIDWFLKLFPEEKPPDSLMNNGYEVIDLERSNDLDELSGITSKYEMINIPNINENYGNNNCKCACHNLTDEKFKKRLRHCLACGTKYIQGRMYAQHGKGLRTVFLNWHTNSEIDQSRRLSSSSSPRQGNPRKRTASIDPQNHTLLSKPDSDDERVSPKRNAKFLKTPTSKGKRSLALTKNLSKNIENNEVNLAQSKNCSKNILKDDEIIVTGNKANADSHKNDILAVSLQNISEDVDFEIVDKFADFKRRFKENELVAETSAPDTISENNDPCIENQQEENRNSENSVFIKSEVTDTECGDNVCSELQENVPTKCENPINNWTREEDKTILLILREETDPQFTISKIQELLPHRKLVEIKERFENVLNLLQKLT